MNNKIQFRRYTALGDALRMLMKQSGLEPELNSRRVYAAWEEASGAGAYTARRYFKDGKLYITVTSSVLRSQLYFQRKALLEKINELLRKDDLFSDNGNGTTYVKELILK